MTHSDAVLLVKLLRFQGEALRDFDLAARHVDPKAGYSLCDDTIGFPPEEQKDVALFLQRWAMALDASILPVPDPKMIAYAIDWLLYTLDENLLYLQEHDAKGAQLGAGRIREKMAQLREQRGKLPYGDLTKHPLAT